MELITRLGLIIFFFFFLLLLLLLLLFFVRTYTFLLNPTSSLLILNFSSIFDRLVLNCEVSTV
jgi:hypothetical protein